MTLMNCWVKEGQHWTIPEDKNEYFEALIFSHFGPTDNGVFSILLLKLGEFI